MNESIIIIPLSQEKIQVADEAYEDLYITYENISFFGMNAADNSLILSYQNNPYLGEDDTWMNIYPTNILKRMYFG